jgi:predicted amidophosphoribosyltransferase
VLDALVASVFPLRCAGCERELRDAGMAVCRRCLPALRAAPEAVPPAGIDAWWAPFAYEGVARELVARVKYRGAHGAITWLAECMAAGVGRPGPGWVVTWAPTTPSRCRSRGFDHAELLARALARGLRLPVRRALWRNEGAPQTGAPAATRRIGPTFVTLGVVVPAVVVVDDVATTGGTLAAAARALRGGGATRVVALTAARTPPRPR